tara:strand:- start:12185 stop:12403 length:219 start_codon:yes stop_codon:yes gene_type:complete
MSCYLWVYFIKDDNLKTELKSKEVTKKPVKFITFTDLYSLKQEKLAELIETHYVYLSGQNIPPIKLTFAELS